MTCRFSEINNTIGTALRERVISTVTDIQNMNEVAVKMKGPLCARGWFKSTENLGASPFRSTTLATKSISQDSSFKLENLLVIFSFLLLDMQIESKFELNTCNFYLLSET
jgi:hypothetical protein